MVKSAFPGERPHRRRSALGVMDRYGDTVGGPLLISSSVGVTPGPAVKGHCGIRLVPGDRRHSGAGVGLYILTLALLAPLTAGTGVGNPLSAIDDGPGGAKSAPPAI